MSNYAKQQEYRLQKTIEGWDNWEVLKYYGSRQKNCGDLLVKCNPIPEKFKQVRIDHKSTRNESSIRIQRAWLSKLSGHTGRLAGKEGYAYPLITLSLYNHRSMWCLGHTGFGITPDRQVSIKENAKSMSINLHDVGYGVLAVDLGYETYIMPLELWREEFENYVRKY